MFETINMLIETINKLFKVTFVRNYYQQAFGSFKVVRKC